MTIETSPLDELQCIVMRSANELCIHSTRLQSMLELRNTRVAELEKTLRSIEMRITALAGRHDATPHDAFELLGIIKASCVSVSVSVRKERPS
jgi:hypothetical protein